MAYRTNHKGNQEKSLLWDIVALIPRIVLGNGSNIYLLDEGKYAVDFLITEPIIE